MGISLSSTILIGLFLCVVDSQDQNLDSFVHSHHMPRDSSGLEKRQAQYIINPCPEFFNNNPPQYCSQTGCGGDTKQRGICDNIRLNGLQERRCQLDGGCGTYCRCRPDEYANGPSYTVQYIGIFCPESYGLPLQKCSEPSCGGDAYYEGICSNILVSGAQGPGCPSGGCGIFCRCDTSPGPDPPSPTATTITITGSDQPIVSMTGPGVPSSDLPAETIEIIQTVPGSSYSSDSSESSSSNLATDLIYTSGPLPEPTAFPIVTVLPPASTTGSGGGVPIIPIIPIPPPPVGFIPPPPGTPNPTEETCPNYQENECSECGGEFGWCQQPPNQGCPCQEACTEGEYIPDCGDEQCEGNDNNQCTIGPQKDCDCKPSCQEGQNRPMCTDSSCQGDTNEQCTEGVLAGCDCFNVPTIISDTYDVGWLAEQQVLLGILSANDPGWEYTTLTGYGTVTPTASQQVTTTSTVPSTTSCWVVRSHTICVKPEKVLTTSDGQLVTETLMETFTESMSSSTPAIVASSAPTPTPSLAIMIYRRDICIVSHGTLCVSTAMEYDVTVGETSVETCEGASSYQAPDYSQGFSQDEAGVTSNYAIDIGPFTTHKIQGCSYIGTNQVIGNLVCPHFNASGNPPNPPIAQTCPGTSVATDTPLVYIEW